MRSAKSKTRSISCSISNIVTFSEQDALVRRLGEMEAFEQAGDLLDDPRFGPGRAPPVEAGTDTLGDHQPQGLGGRELGKQLIDLKRSGNPEPGAPVRPEIRDIHPLEQ